MRIRFIKAGLLARHVKMVMWTIFFAFTSIAMAEPGGQLHITSDVTQVVAGDIVTLDVSFSAHEPNNVLETNIINSGSFVISWDSEDFALDASPVLGTVGDNDPDGTLYLSAKQLQNNQNQRLDLAVDDLGYSDLWELTSNNGRHQLNLYRMKAFGGDSLTSDYHLFTIKLIAKQGVASGTSDIEARIPYILDNQGSKAGGSEFIASTVRLTSVNVDIVSPVITLIGNEVINLNVGDAYVESGTTVTDNVDTNLSAVVTGEVNTSIPGLYTLIYTATDSAGNVGTARRVINVTDVIAPIINAPSNITLITTNEAGIPVSDNAIAAFLAVTAEDDVDGIVAVTHNAPVIFPHGPTTVSFTASDSAGNTSVITAIVNIVYEDVVAPVVTLIGEANINLSLGDIFNDAGAIAIDNIDGDITSSITLTGVVNSTTAGIYTLTYTVTDSSGNQTAVIRTVNVSDTVAPVITISEGITVEATSAQGTTEGNGVISAFLSSVSVTDDSGLPVTVTHNAPALYPEGMTVVTFTATDSAGNTSVAETHIRVVISDSDNDGMPDYYEVANGLNPNDPSDAEGDSDGDGISNLDEFTGETDISEDTTAPVFTAPENLTVNSTGALTAVEFGVVTGLDDVDGIIAATADNAGPFAPGSHVITWTVTDAAGNSTSDEQLVYVIPMVDVSESQTTDEGNTVVVELVLNGNAAFYPVTVPYTVTGTATNKDDYNELSGEVIIEAGTTGSISITTLEDSSFEGEENIVISLGEPTNAIIGLSTVHTVSIVEENIAPSLAIDLSQNGEAVTTVYGDQGIVEIKLTVSDPNPNDTHAIDWSETDNNLVATEESPESTFTFDPSGLTNGLYEVKVSAQDNGLSPLLVTVETSVLIISTAPTLDDITDTDGDGVSDSEEGLGDADANRIPDYLDGNVVEHQLPVSPETGPIQTSAGLSLRLGETAFELGHAGAGVTEEDIIANSGSAGGLGDENFDYPLGLLDFEVTGASLGESVNIVLPLSAGIPEGAVYRKFLPETSVWQDFVVNSKNSISSASTTVGACPPAGDEAYSDGLTVGFVCVQLSIEDGGPNDTDGVVNGVIADPSGIAVEAATNVEEPESPDEGGSTAAESTPKSSGGGGGGGGSIDIWFLLLMSLLTGISAYRRQR